MDAKQNNGMVSVLADLDDYITALTDLKNILYLFDELLWDDVRFLDPQKGYTTEHFKGRFDTTHSMLSVVLIRLHEIIDLASAGVDEGFRICRKSAPAQVENTGKATT